MEKFRIGINKFTILVVFTNPAASGVCGAEIYGYR
jgi:hypothetical protein